VPSQEELDAEYSGSDLEAKVRRLESTVNGLMESGLDRLLASGILQFDGIPMRWDTKGMQLKSPLASDARTALYIVNELASNPNLSYPRGAVRGYTDPAAASIEMRAYRTALINAGISIFTGSGVNGPSVSLEATDGTVAAGITVSTGTGVAQITIGGGSVRLFQQNSDPSSPQDGEFWYNATDNKLYARINGATVELGAGGGGVGIVTNPFEWQGAWGHDFRFNAGNADLITTAAAGNPSGLSGHGWVATALSVTEGSSGDFLSSSDINPTRIVWNAASDSLVSPRIFGSYDHMLIAAESLGATPTKLCCEVFAAWKNYNFGENTSWFGFAAPGTADSTAAGAAACIAANTSVWYLKSDNGSDTATAAVDTAWHKWRIEVGASTTEWFIDDVSQGTITTETDIWPTSFKAFTSNNLFDIAWFRVYYE